MRRPHYIKPNHRTTIPRHCVWVDTETLPKRLDETTEAHFLHFGFAAYSRRKKKDTWTKPKWLRFDLADEFWDWLVAQCPARSKTYVFAHNWAFDAPVLGAFHALPERGWRCRGALVDGPPTLIPYHLGNRTIVLMDTLNIWRVPLAEIGKSIGLRKLRMPGTGASQARWDAYARRDVKVIMRAVQLWCSFLRREDLGNFSVTLASQALCAYRHRFMDTPIYCDNKRAALELSREALHGGRTECYRLGKIEKPLYLLDVNSLYPHVMASFPYPTKLQYCGSGMSLSMVRDRIATHCVVARVDLDVTEPAYGHVVNNRLVFPTGRITTVLCTPELEHAFSTGEIAKVRRVAIYHHGDIFSRYVSYFWNMRLRAREQGDTVLESQCKLLLNSLYGKFGQRGKIWEDHDTVPVTDPLCWVETNAQTGKRTTWRSLAGLLQRQIDKGESFNSHPAIAAHVTAYGRMHLWKLIQAAGRDHVYYCDTDSVLVDQAGRWALDHHMGDNVLGLLKQVGTYTNVELRGAKDYTLDDKTKIKGIRRDAIAVGPHTYEQVCFSGLKGMLRKGQTDAPRVTTVRKTLTREYTKGDVSPSGQITPLALREW